MVSLRPPDNQAQPKCLVLPQCNWGTVIAVHPVSHQEGIISETYVRLDKFYIREPPELGDLLDTSKLVQNFLPKQTNID